MEPEHPQFAEPAEAVGLELKTEIEPGLKLRGVPETVTELAGILLDNAVKYSAPGSVISLRLVREGGRSVLSVRNRCEERPREPERLFDRFYRGDAARTQSSGGSGLGLAIARALAENLHGSLSVETPGETDLEFVARFP
uniref:ATP-binding protein n=1 Tax=Candidatus Scatomorpha intestinigallinarum TaxID=2840923 RepID=UPI004028EEBB